MFFVIRFAFFRRCRDNIVGDADARATDEIGRFQPFGPSFRGYAARGALPCDRRAIGRPAGNIRDARGPERATSDSAERACGRLVSSGAIRDCRADIPSSFAIPRSDCQPRPGPTSTAAGSSSYAKPDRVTRGKRVRFTVGFSTIVQLFLRGLRFSSAVDTFHQFRFFFSPVSIHFGGSFGSNKIRTPRHQSRGRGFFLSNEYDRIRVQ